MSGKFLFFNNSASKESIGLPSAHLVADGNDAQEEEFDDGINEDLNPKLNTEEQRETDKDSSQISETSYQNEEISSESELVNTDEVGSATTATPVKKDSPVSEGESEKKISVSSSHDDLQTIDWHRLSVEEIDEIYFRNKDVCIENL